MPLRAAAIEGASGRLYRQTHRADGAPQLSRIEIADLDTVERALTDVPVVKPRHDTFYGSTEIYVREPGGNTVGFAQFS